MKRMSGKNTLGRFQARSVEAARLEGAGYSPRGGDGDFLTPFKNLERGFSMNRELTQTLRGLGNALIKSYFHDWLPEKKRIDRYLEDVVLNSPILKADRVQGGDHVTPQERLLQLKEEHEGYRTLSRNIGRMEAFLDGLSDDERTLINIGRMEAFLDGLSDDERTLINLRYCQGLEFWEISFKLKKERGDVLKNLFSIQGRLGGFWTGEGEVA